MATDWILPRVLGTFFLLTAAFVEVLTAIGHAAWRFGNLEPMLTIALERLAREWAELTSTTVAFVAFVQRALKHPSYTAGHFDPGRMPA